MAYKIRANKSHRAYRWIRLLGLVSLLMTSVLVLTACDASAKLTVENRMSTDVVIIHEAIDRQGESFLQEELGMVPAQQTVDMRYELFLRPDVIGWTVLLKAEDPSGNVVWQKIWPFDEFLELKDVGWKIVVSPETGS